MPLRSATISTMGNEITFKPLNDKVVILPNDDNKTTTSGLYVPDLAQGHQNKGTVVATGPGKMLQDGSRGAMQVKPGDTVWYNSVAGFKVTKDSVDYYAVSEEQVFVIE